MNRQGFCFILILLFAGLSSSSGQDKALDILKTELATASEDSTKYIILNKIVTHIQKTDKISSLPYVEQLVSVAESLGNKSKLANSYRELGNLLLFKSDNDGSTKYLEKSNSLALEIGDSSLYIKNLGNLALIYQRTNDYEKALVTYQEVIEKANKFNNYYLACSALVNAASLQIDQESYSPAISYLQQVEKIFNTIPKDSIQAKKKVQDIMPNAYLNMGMCFDATSRPDTALTYYNSVLKACDLLENKFNATYIKAYAYSSIGDIYKEFAKKDGLSLKNKNKELFRALDYYSQSYNSFSSIEISRGQTFSLNNIGLIQTQLGQFDEADQSLKRALLLAKEQDFMEEVRDSYQFLAENAANKQDYKNSYEYYKYFVEYKDSLLNEDRVNSLQEMESKYQTKQQQAEIAQLAAENELKQRRQTFQLILFIVSLLAILGLGWTLYTRNKYKQEKKAADFERSLNQAMSRFVPIEFIKTLGRDKITDVQLGDQVEKDVTVLFTDIRSFTTLSEEMTPVENFQFVKKYAERMGPIIQRNHGFINQYMGDGIMAIFQNNPSDALIACIEMFNSIDVYNIELAKNGKRPIAVGMGMHFGSLVMGIIGDEARRDAALISDTVNTAARMESTTKIYGSRILLSEDSYEMLDKLDRFKFRFLGSTMMKGKHIPVKFFECIDAYDEEKQEKIMSSLDSFNNGIDAYFSNKLTKAKIYFDEVLRMNPDDSVSLYYRNEIDFKENVKKID